MVIGSIVAIVRIGAIEGKYPPPGKLIDVGGYRMHIMAEGEAHGQPTLVWLPGGHGQGLTMHNLHKRMRGTTRSILFDRPGTGWSDTGPFPRRTGREAEELATLLENAGEKGPFVLVGHSYGGLLAANFARRHPDRVAAVVLLDATPPDTMSASLSGQDALAGQVLINRGLAFSKLMGFQLDFYAMLAKKYPEAAKTLQVIEGELADVRPMIRARDAHPRYDLTTASIFEEFSADNFRRSGMDFIVYDGELADLPVYVVIPQGDMAKSLEQMKMDPALKRRMLAFMDKARLRYMQTSTRSALIAAPAGSGHNFPYEHPDFVMDVVRQALANGRK